MATPFNAHLIALLSVYKQGPYPGANFPDVPAYDGPVVPEGQEILHSLEFIAQRMWTAEEQVRSLKISKEENTTLAPNTTSSEVPGPESLTLQPPLDPPTVFNLPSATHHCPSCGQLLLSANTSSGPEPLLSSEYSESPLAAAEELKLLKAQISDVARVCNAVAHGDLTQKVIVPVQGIFMVQFKDAINGMVDKLAQFAKEVSRTGRLDFRTEGVLGGTALVLEVEGIWRELTGIVNKLASNFTNTIRSVAQVTKAVALGDLSRQIEFDARGELLDLKQTVNGMVVQLRAVAVEVARVTVDVGTKGKLGGQAHVPDVEGVWLELVGNVNGVCAALTDQVRSMATATTAVARGDFTQKIIVLAEGEIGELKNKYNSLVDDLSVFASEITRVSLEVGTEGILGSQAQLTSARGTWKDITENVNLMAMNIMDQVRSIARVTKAVAEGDFTEKIDVEARGEFLRLKESVNGLTGLLSAVTDEVTRLTTEEKWTGHAKPLGVSGRWKGMLDDVNLVAYNRVLQVRTIAVVITAVTRGDLTQKITANLPASGETLELVHLINAMIDYFSGFAAEIKRVDAEGVPVEVGIVPIGCWQEIATAVNTLAAKSSTTSV